MITPQLQEKINAIKAQRLPVYSVQVGSSMYIYRGINRKEFKELQSQMTKAAEDLRAQYPKKEDETKLSTELALLKEKSEEALVAIALVEPEIKDKELLETLPAGLVTRLSDLITSASGFIDVPEEPKQL